MRKKLLWLVLLALAILALAISPALAGGDNHRRRWHGDRFALVGEVTAVDTENGTIKVLVSMGSRAMRDYLDLEVTLVTSEDTRFRCFDDPPGEFIELVDIEVDDIVSVGGRLAADEEGTEYFLALRVTKGVPFEMPD